MKQHGLLSTLRGSGIAARRAVKSDSRRSEKRPAAKTRKIVSMAARMT